MVSSVAARGSRPAVHVDHPQSQQSLRPGRSAPQPPSPSALYMTIFFSVSMPPPALGYSRPRPPMATSSMDDYRHLSFRAHGQVYVFGDPNTPSAINSSEHWALMDTWYFS